MIASNLPAIRDVVPHGETGLLVTAGDEVELASAIRKLILDEELASQLAESGGNSARGNFD